MSIVRSPVRSVVRSPVQGVFGGASLLEQATSALGNVAPYHYLDFIANRALYAGIDVGAVTGATGYSFSRASDGYYENSDGTLTNFASGALRRGDRGVLIEGARTNLLTYSQEFDDASWTDANTTVSANSTNAPDGTTTADILTATTSTSVGKSKTFTGTAAAYTCSLIAKAGTSSWLRIATSNGTSTINSWFNLSSGATGTTEAGQTSTIVPLSDGYYICSVVRTMAATTCTVFYRFANADNGVTGTSGQTQTWWGAQVELGGFVSSYIPTTTASATRAADSLSYTVNTTAQIQAAVAGQPELVTNGTFAANLNDWTNASTGTGTATWSAGAASLVRVDAGNAGIIRQSFTTVAGANYAIAYSAGGAVLKAGVGTSALDDSLSNTTAAAGATTVALFRATGTTTHIYFIPNANSTTATVDNVSVKEVPANSLTLYPLSLFSEFERVVDTGTNEGLISVSASATNLSDLDIDGSDNIELRLNVGGLAGFPAVSGAVAVGAVTKAAARVSNLDHRAVRNGTLGTANTALGVPSTPATIRVGLLTAGGNPLFGYLRRCAIFNTALSDADLQAVTS